MPHYKDTENKVHFLDSKDYEHVLPIGSTLISDEEVAILLAPAPTSYEEAIAMLEKSITARRLREAVLSVEGKNWLIAKETEIESNRVKIKQRGGKL